MRKITSGFTIIELLVVIAVIGILTTISALSFTRYQADGRDSQRDQRATVIVEALEKYFLKNGEYPSCASITSSADTVKTSVLPGIDTTVLVTPKAVDGLTTSVVCSDLTSTSGPDVFAYVGDGSTACSGSGSCLEYTIKYVQESTDSIKTISSRQNADIRTSGAISNLAGTANQFSSASLTWTAVSNANNYTLQASTVIGFGTIAATSTPTTNSATMTGLTPGTTYYFRVLPNAPSSLGDWSNILTLPIPQLATPVASATYNPSNPTTQLDVSWGAISGAASYRIDWQTVNNGFTSSYTTISNVVGTSYTLTGVATGTTVYFRVFAIAPDDTSNASTTVNASTIVPPLTCLNTTDVTTTSIRASWSACPSAIADNYDVEYASNSGFTSSTIIAGVTGNSSVVSGLTQGKTYWFRVFAKVGSASSTASPSANRTTSINTPTSVSITTTIPGGIRAYAAGDWVAWISSPSSGNWYYAQGTAGGSCPSGTTRQFQHGANYNSPTTFYGYTGWSTTATKYMVDPYSGYAIRFHVNARCVGSDATSGTVNDVSAYVYG